MSIVAFILVGVLFTMYVLTDGYDLGIAAITPLVARNERERFASMRSIGPFWNGNEVWLIAGGGVLFALFPQVYASAFSGFYLPFMVVLWLLMFRGIALELRSHLISGIWRSFWDAAFSLSSTLLILLFGVAIGNLVRGVPLDAEGYFVGTFAFLLNPYALGVGLFALAALALHGLLFLMLRVNGPPADRARLLALRAWPLPVVLYLAITGATFALRPTVLQYGFWTFCLPIFGLAVLLFIRRSIVHARIPQAFIGSCVFLISLLGAAGATMFPYLLLGYPTGSGGISLQAASPPPGALFTTLSVSIVGLGAVVLYTGAIIRLMREKITL